MATKRKVQKAFSAFVWITYDETVEGGEICDSEENDAWPSHEPAYYDWKLLGVSVGSPVSQIHNAFIPCGLITDKGWLDWSPMSGNECWVVIVTYNSGGTFGSSYGHGCAVCVCADLESATFIKQQIRAREQLEMLSYCPWDGYFESLEGVRIEKHVIKAFSM